MKTAISIPDDTFAEAESLAKRLGMSRSHLYATAVEQFVQAHRDTDITKRLNEVYGAEPATVDPVLSALQFAALPSDEAW